MSSYRKNMNHYPHSSQYTPYQHYYAKEADRILTTMSTNFNKQYLKSLIDDALDNRDEEQFYELTTAYNKLYNA